MVYVKELPYGDTIFNLGDEPSYNSNSGVKNDSRYERQLIKIYVFKTFTNTEAYAVTDGVPLTIPYDYGKFCQLDKLLNISTKGSTNGVYVIKQYRYTRISQLTNLLKFWENCENSMPDEAIELLRKNIIEFEKGGQHTLTYRLVEFIEYKDLLKGDIYNRLLGGTISLEIKSEYQHLRDDNVISIEISGNGKPHWLVLGDTVVPLISNNKINRSTITVSHSNSTIDKYNIENLSDYNIFDNYEEAYANTISTSLRKEKILHEQNKLRLEEKKIIMDMWKLKEQKEMLIFTNKIQYQTEVIKLIIAENNLKMNEYNMFKSSIEGGIKIFTLIETTLKKFI